VDERRKNNPKSGALKNVYFWFMSFILVIFSAASANKNVFLFHFVFVLFRDVVGNFLKLKLRNNFFLLDIIILDIFFFDGRFYSPNPTERRVLKI